jgi:GNAT superfamily N-acetyltransferase
MAIKQQVTTYYLEMLKQSDFIPKPEFNKIEIKPTSNGLFLNWILFAGVGLPWKWYSKFKWTEEQWDKFILESKSETYLAFHENTLVGYFELEKHHNNEVEIVFFGLLPEYLGKRLGGLLLSKAIDTAWSLKPDKIWLHTCDNDSPKALDNYKARGFVLFRQTTELEEVPEKTDFLNFIYHFFNRYIDRFS